MSASPKADNLPWPELPKQKAGVLSLDLPWHFASRAPSANPHVSRNPQRHYPTADIPHLCTLPVREMCLPDAHVMLWMTGPLLAAAVHRTLFKAWGVRPSSMLFVWIKLKPSFDMEDLRRTPLLEEDLIYGTGFTTMQNAEYVILGRIGSPSRARRDIRQVIISNRREHSRKPDEFYRRAQHYATGPYVDAFGGQPRENWEYWGMPHRDGVGPAAAAE